MTSDPAWGEIWLTADGRRAYITDVGTFAQGCVDGVHYAWLARTGEHGRRPELDLTEQIGWADVPTSLGPPWWIDPPAGDTQKDLAPRGDRD